MLLESNTKECGFSLENFSKLNDYEKLDLVAILMDHWSKNQILNDKKEIFESNEINFYNIDDFSALCLLLARVIKKDSNLILYENDIEHNIDITKNINICLTNFYKLNFNDKLHYIIEILFDVSTNKKISSKFDILNIIYEIYNINLIYVNYKFF